MRSEHKARRRELLLRHPELRKLQGHFSGSASFIVLLVAAHITVAVIVCNSSYSCILLVAYLVGAFISNALWVFIHEASHNLIVRSPRGNCFWLLFSNMTHIIPSAISFRHYHLLHHTSLGTVKDLDLPTHFEVHYFTQSSLRRVLWLFLYPVLISERVVVASGVSRPRPALLILNGAINAIFSVIVTQVISWRALTYFVASFFFSLSLHVLGARWIAEHFDLIQSNQETYSYYGPLNLVSFNVGYHTEHHDLPTVPWKNLPILKKTAPEFYVTRYFHTSYIRVLLDFFFGVPPAPYHSMLEARKTRPCT